MSTNILSQLLPLNFIMPVIIAVVFIFIMSVLPEPTRQKFNAIFVAGAGAAYLSGGLGSWEFVFTIVATIIAYKGLSSYKYIGLAWLLHSFWDIMHVLYGNPIIPVQPSSSFGCAITDPIIAIWFLFGAPSVYQMIHIKKMTHISS